MEETEDRNREVQMAVVIEAHWGGKPGVFQQVGDTITHLSASSQTHVGSAQQVSLISCSSCVLDRPQLDSMLTIPLRKPKASFCIFMLLCHYEEHSELKVEVQAYLRDIEGSFPGHCNYKLSHNLFCWWRVLPSCNKMRWAYTQAISHISERWEARDAGEGRESIQTASPIRHLWKERGKSSLGRKSLMPSSSYTPHPWESLCQLKKTLEQRPFIRGIRN